MEQLSDPRHDIYETIVVIVYIRREIRSSSIRRSSYSRFKVVVIVVDIVDVDS